MQERYELARFRYRPQVETEIANGDRMGQHTHGIAVNVARQVPRHMPGHRRSAPFYRRLYVRDLPGGEAVVGTRWKLGHIIEWGSINNPPYAPLRRAARAAGLTFRATYRR